MARPPRTKEGRTCFLFCFGGGNGGDEKKVSFFRFVSVRFFLFLSKKKNLLPSHHHGVAQLVRGLERRVLARHHRAGRLLDVELPQQLVPQVAVLGRVDRLGLRAPDAHVPFARGRRDRVRLEVLGERRRELERGLPSELDDDAVGAALLDDVEDVLD